VTKCFYKKKKQSLPKVSVPKGLKKKQLETLNEVFSYLKVERAIFYSEKEHFIENLPNENPYENQVLWQEIKKYPDAQVIIDTYFFGFVFTRKTQAKEEFLIRL